MKDIIFWKNFIEKIKKEFKGLDFEMVAMESNSGLTRFTQIGRASCRERV